MFFIIGLTLLLLSLAFIAPLEFADTACVSAVDAVRYVQSITRSKRNMSTFMEMYGAGRIVTAADARREACSSQSAGQGEAKKLGLEA